MASSAVLYGRGDPPGRPYDTMRKTHYRSNRHSIRLPNYDYGQDGVYYVTICTFNRECLFGDVVDGTMELNEFGEIVAECWNNIHGQFPNVELDQWVIMPNHVHGIIHIVGAIHELPLQVIGRKQRRNMLLPKMVGYFKMNAAKRINLLRDNSGWYPSSPF